MDADGFTRHADTHTAETISADCTCLHSLWSRLLLWGSEAIPLDSDGPSGLWKDALRMIQHHLKTHKNQKTFEALFMHSHSPAYHSYCFINSKRSIEISNKSIFFTHSSRTTSRLQWYIVILQYDHASGWPLVNLPWIATVGFQNMSEFLSSCVLSLLTAMILLRLFRTRP